MDGPLDKPRSSAKPRPTQPTKRKVCLALQGGGAHGAFTWGVLDRLLVEEDLEIEGVSATSAGAMNGAMLTTGVKVGGRQFARERLKDFWRKIRDSSPLNKPPWAFWTGVIAQAEKGNAFDMHPGYMVGDVMSRFLSPYQFNPTNVNPLRNALESTIDFSVINRLDEPRLFVSATDVQSGRAKIFMGEELSVDALLASACLPTVFQAVRIEGRDYWDGGYTGNPPIWPLIYHCKSEDVIVVHINPIERPETPVTARGILNRVNEISFNSNLMGEMRAIDTVARLIRDGLVPENRYKNMRMHAIADEETMRTLSSATKLNPAWTMLKDLRDAGRAAADRWLKAHKDDIGVRNTVDIRERYL